MRCRVELKEMEKCMREEYLEQWRAADQYKLQTYPDGYGAGVAEGRVLWEKTTLVHAEPFIDDGEVGGMQMSLTLMHAVVRLLDELPEDSRVRVGVFCRASYPKFAYTDVWDVNKISLENIINAILAVPYHNIDPHPSVHCPRIRIAKLI